MGSECRGMRSRRNKLDEPNMTSGASSMIYGPVGSRLRDIVLVTALALAGMFAMGCSPAKEEAAQSPGSMPVPGEIVSIQGEPLSPTATMKEVLDHPDPFERAKRVSEILQRSGPEDLDDLMHAFETAPLEKGDLEYGLFGYWWARFDPQAAFTYADNTLRTDHGSVILQVVRAWAHADPIGALESDMLTSRDTQSPGIREELTDVFTISWFESGLPGLEDWMVQQQDPRGIANSLRAYGRMKIFEMGPEAALEWSRTAPFEDADRRLIMAGMLNIIAHQYPEMAIDWIRVAEEDGVDTRTFTSRVARSWAHHEPEKAVEWILAEVESEYDRGQALNQATRRWLRKDEPGLAKWLEGHVGEKWSDLMRNQDIRWYIRKNFFQVDWADAMNRALAISQENFRHGMAAWVLQRWFVVNINDAEAWLVANPDAIPPDFVERARKISPIERAEIEEALAHHGGVKS